MKHKIEYIFCINTGRSGSEYLSGLFRHVHNSYVEHEALPIGCGSGMRDYFFGKTELMKKITEEKVNNMTKDKPKSTVYIETNHCFIKGFGWFLPDYIPQEKIGVIILTRNPEKIVKSTLRIGCSPLLTKGRKWILTPDIDNYHIQPPTWFISAKITYKLFLFFKRRFISPRKVYDLFYLRSNLIQNLITKYEEDCVQWYIDETTALSNDYQKRFPNIKYFHVDLESLNDMTKVRELFEFFGLEATKTLTDVVGKPVNLKLEYKDS